MPKEWPTRSWRTSGCRTRTFNRACHTSRYDSSCLAANALSQDRNVPARIFPVFLSLNRVLPQKPFFNPHARLGWRANPGCQESGSEAICLCQESLKAAEPCLNYWALQTWGMTESPKEECAAAEMQWCRKRAGRMRSDEEQNRWKSMAQMIRKISELNPEDVSGTERARLWHETGVWFFRLLRKVRVLNREIGNLEKGGFFRDFRPENHRKRAKTSLQIKNKTITAIITISYENGCYYDR